MIYIWILKYILYNAFTRKNLVAAYFEGGSFGLIIVMPIISILMIFKIYNANHILYFVPFLILFDTYITWNDDYVFRKYRYIEINHKDSLTKKYKTVQWFIFLDILFFILTIVYVGIRRNYM